jgi:hypothetical protein
MFIYENLNDFNDEKNKENEDLFSYVVLKMNNAR